MSECTALACISRSPTLWESALHVAADSDVQNAERHKPPLPVYLLAVIYVLRSQTNSSANKLLLIPSASTAYDKKGCIVLRTYHF